ncbi:protein PAXX [Pholidichthys leucotaenia]
MKMDADVGTCLCCVVDPESRSRFVVYTDRKAGDFRVCLTDAAAVWTSKFSQDSLTQFKQKFSLKSAEDFIQKLRSSSSSALVSVVVRDDVADLLLGPGPGEPRLTLSRLDQDQTSEELKELLFTVVGKLTHSNGGASSVGAVKAQQRTPAAEFEPRQQNGGPSVAVKRRIPGASLINPGTKKKQKATGVAFDDVDED